MMADEKAPLRLRQLILSDLERISVRFKGGLWPLYYMLTIPGFSTALLHRLSHAFYERGFLGRHLGLFFWHLNLFMHSCDISYRAVIGAGLFIPHPIGIVIGSGYIGNNFTVYQNTTVGLRTALEYQASRSAYPALGDNVILSAGASILGPIKIGNNAIIGANAVVLKDVPDNATAVGVPARVIPKKPIEK